MFMIDIGGMRLLYTGDYSRLADRHLSAADLPDSLPDIGEHQNCLTTLMRGRKEGLDFVLTQDRAVRLPLF